MKRSKKMIDSNQKTKSKQPVLALDLIGSILERLSFVDFHSARCVSSEWYSTSESCIGRVTNPTTPWLILFPKEDIESNNIGSCKLYNPSDHNSYTVRELGFDFATSRCLVNSGSWFLMLDGRSVFYVLNLFTRERIPLPSMESVDGWQIGDSGRFSSEKSIIGNAVLWVDERSRDYFVVWNFDNLFAYHKKGDANNSWKVLKPLKNEGCLDMVFKENKFYVLSVSRSVIVFDFSYGDPPMEKSYPLDMWYVNIYFYYLAVSLSGEALVILGQAKSYSTRGFFAVYKMDPESSQWNMIRSIGDEALLMDQGITVAAKDGVMKNCIYFSNHKFRRYEGTNLGKDDNGICVYNIQTQEVVQEFPHLIDSSPLPFKDARWFFPTCGG